ncbi:aminoacyl-tRNA hydrolase, partial [bacterium]|nr:aminoacyl-tRNA hydrolase [bacterium]
RSVMDFYKIPLSELIVVHDDLDIDFGKFKIQTGIGPKVHNGVNSIEDHMGSKEFVRVRIGINDPQAREVGFSGEEFVLQNFTEAQLTCLTEDIFPEINNELIK